MSTKKKAAAKEAPTLAELKQQVAALITQKKKLPDSYRAKMGGHSLVADMLDEHLRHAQQALDADDRAELQRCSAVLEQAQAVD